MRGGVRFLKDMPGSFYKHFTPLQRFTKDIPKDIPNSLTSEPTISKQLLSKCPEHFDYSFNWNTSLITAVSNLVVSSSAKSS